MKTNPMTTNDQASRYQIRSMAFFWYIGVMWSAVVIGAGKRFDHEAATAAW
jgi:hypothetical protein